MTNEEKHGQHFGLQLHDTNLNPLSTQTLRGQELLGHINKNMRQFRVAHEI